MAGRFTGTTSFPAWATKCWWRSSMGTSTCPMSSAPCGPRCHHRRSARRWPRSAPSAPPAGTRSSSRTAGSHHDPDRTQSDSGASGRGVADRSKPLGGTHPVRDRGGLANKEIKLGVQTTRITITPTEIKIELGGSSIKLSNSAIDDERANDFHQGRRHAPGPGRDGDHQLSDRDASRCPRRRPHVSSRLVAGPGVPTVLIGGMPPRWWATCIPARCLPRPVRIPPTPFPKGSATVLIGGRPALRMTDVSGCGAPIVSGAFTVLIG